MTKTLYIQFEEIHATLHCDLDYGHSEDFHRDLIHKTDWRDIEMAPDREVRSFVPSLLDS